MNEQENRGVAPEVTYVERREPKNRNKLVFISSIILTIAGFIALAMVILGYIALNSGMVDIPGEIRVEPASLIFGAILILSQLIFAIIGLRSAHLPRRGKLLMILGIIMLVSQAVDTFIALQTGQFSPSFILGFFLKGMYAYGGYQLHQRHKKDYVNLPDYEEI